jgi:hypothetical protein
MKKKTVGIITIHKSLVSYGASLQAYALWEYLKSLHYNCEIIDLYRPVIKGYIYDAQPLSFSTIEKKEKTNLKSYIKNFLRKVLKSNKSTNAKKTKRFQAFNSLIDYSNSFKSIASLYKAPPVYDYYISGSDQIWNPDMPFENEPYLLSFVPNNKKRISYASSFGRNSLPEQYKNHYQKHLKKYSCISVREKSGQYIINELLGEAPFIALDPTMLFDNSYWQSLAIKPDLKKKYIFCFSLINNEELIGFASTFCENNNLVLVSLSEKSKKYGDLEFVNASDSGPKEWLGWIENAELIITDSFHGTLFSILFQKPFYSYIKKDNKETNLGTRIENILHQLSLGYRLLTSLNSTVDQSNMIIDYSLVNNKLDALRSLSIKFLEEALS